MSTPGHAVTVAGQNAQDIQGSPGQRAGGAEGRYACQHGVGGTPPNGLREAAAVAENTAVEEHGGSRPPTPTGPSEQLRVGAGPTWGDAKAREEASAAEQRGAAVGGLPRGSCASPEP